MNEHPVPRNVTGFQFQLIGNMTLKQFGYLLAGVLLGFAFFRAPISFFRFPLAAFFGFLGVAFAFIPIQERPLEIWLVNLIKSVYAPTQFVWEKEIRIPDLFTQKFARVSPVKETQAHQDTSSKLATYLASVAQKEEERLDARETQTLKQVSDLFGQTITVKQVAVPVKSITSPLSSISHIFAHDQPIQKPVATPTHTTSSLTPGTVMGLVKSGQVALSGILIHITDAAGNQTRLFKTNKEGKFGSTIPLDKGKYHLSIEDPSGTYTFKSFPFEVDTAGLHPWLIIPENQIS